MIICSHVKVYAGKLVKTIGGFTLYKKRKAASGQIHLLIIKSLLMYEYHPISEDYPDVVMGL